MTRAVCPLHATALRYPEAPAVIGPSGEVLTYRECDRKAQAVASAFGARGIEAGKRLAFVDPADIRSLPVLFGAFRAGLAVYIPNKHLPQAGLQENIARVGCSHVVGRRPMGSSLPSLDPEELIGPSPIEGLLDVDPYAPATILATSGTTAEPKMAVHSLDNHIANAETSNKNISLRPGDRWLLSLPLYHVAGLGIIFRCVVAGAAVALAERGEALEGSIARLKVTHVSLVATQLERLLTTPDGRETLSRLKAVLLGGSAIPQNLIERAVGLGVPLHTTYGLTETASQVTT
ncbi:MAG: AMP-binding protein, partial [Candidatus Hydrogenedentes bacterium]|nr:AMP-binding protein [Candidatus Hydrogenedentota bacterium]